MPKHSNGKRQSPRKPEMERKRRQRINKCLSQIKLLIPEAKQLEIKKGCRLEKAEILEIAVQFIQRVQSEQKVEKRGETSVAIEECPVFFNPSTAPTRPLFQSHLDIPQDPHSTPTPALYPAPTCCLDLNECDCRDSPKYMPPNTLYRPAFTTAYPRIFTPRCVSSNMGCDSARSGLETFAFQPQQSKQHAQSAELPLLKTETD